MHRITATTRIAICLAFLSVTVVLSARMVGLVPDAQQSVAVERTRFCEAVAIQSSYLASKNDIAGLRTTLRAIVQRNGDLLSGSLIRVDGSKVVQVGNHQSDQRAGRHRRSTRSTVVVPIMAGSMPWGTIELAFRPLQSSGLSRLIHDPLVRLCGFVFASGGLIYLIYLRKVLQHLDPSKVVPDRVRNALDTLSEGLILLDRSERIVMANQAFTRVANQSDSELLGRRASELAWSNEFGADVDLFPWTKAANDGVPGSGTLYYQNPSDGRRQIFKVNTVPVLSEDKKIRGVLVCFDDVTLLHQKMEELGHLKQELVDTAREAGMAEIATDVLHNVGNVLNSVNVSVTMLSQSVKESRVSYLDDLTQLISDHRNELGDFLTSDERGKRVPDFLSKLTEQIRQEQEKNMAEINTLGECVEHIKEIVRMQQSYAKVSAVLEQCDPIALMDDALRFADVSIEKNNIKVVREYEDAPEIAVAKGKLLQALVNLIKNAKDSLIEKSGPNRTITLRTRFDGDRVRFEVADNGGGISKENLTKIFAHGFTTKKAGHGFGLHGSALAIKEMGGDLRVHSPGPGQGATFTLDVPINEGALAT